MRRYWVPDHFISGSHVELSDEVFHHICVVCRQEVGDRFEVIASQKAYFVEVEIIKKKKALAKIIEERQVPALPLPHIHLALSVPKFQTFERVLEKAVELGVSHVHPFTSDFSFIKPKKGDLLKKQDRWQKIIRGATQQTGRGELMQLTEVQPLGVLLKQFTQTESSWGVLAYEGSGEMTMGQTLRQAPTSLAEAWVFVGSEGGFSPRDLDLFKDSNLLPVSLGDQVLRVETACVTLLSLLKYGLGHFG